MQSSACNTKTLMQSTTPECYRPPFMTGGPAGIRFSAETRDEKTIYLGNYTFANPLYGTKTERMKAEIPSLMQYKPI